MGRVRNRAVILVCQTCNAGIDVPCTNRATGKPLKNFHRSRLRGAVADVRGPAIRKLTGFDEEFWMWVWMYFGCREHKYPNKNAVDRGAWQELYRKHREVDPADRYWGQW